MDLEVERIISSIEALPEPKRSRVINRALIDIFGTADMDALLRMDVEKKAEADAHEFMRLQERG